MINQDLKTLIDFDCKTMSQADAKALGMASAILDDFDVPDAVRAMARAMLVTAIHNHAGTPLAAMCAIAVSKHCMDKKRRARVLEAALGDDPSGGSDQIHTLLADLAMQRGDVREAAYHLRCARRIIFGD